MRKSMEILRKNSKKKDDKSAGNKLCELYFYILYVEQKIKQ